MPDARRYDANKAKFKIGDRKSGNSYEFKNVSPLTLQLATATLAFLVMSAGLGIKGQTAQAKESN